MWVYAANGTRVDVAWVRSDVRGGCLCSTIKSYSCAVLSVSIHLVASIMMHDVVSARGEPKSLSI